MITPDTRRAAELRAQMREHEPDRSWLWRRVDWNVDIKAGKRGHRVARALKDGAEAKWLAAEIRRLVAEHGEG